MISNLIFKFLSFHKPLLDNLCTSIATRKMQSSSNELSTFFSESTKCKQTKLKIYALIHELTLSPELDLGVCHQQNVKLDSFDPGLKRITYLATLKSWDTRKRSVWG